MKKSEAILFVYAHQSARSPNLEISIPRLLGENVVVQTRKLTLLC
jgi:hypothetical protein